MGASIQRTAGFCWLATNFMIDHSPDGEVAEWLNAPHSKCGIRVTVSGVRIPPSPPEGHLRQSIRSREMAKAAYGVRETIELLSIGRTSLYAAVRRGELRPVKFGKKTLFYAIDLAAFLTRLKEAAAKSEAAPLRRRHG